MMTKAMADNKCIVMKRYRYITKVKQVNITTSSPLSTMTILEMIKDIINLQYELKKIK